MKPKKQCNHPACRTLIPFDERYCDQHEGLRRRETNKAYDTARQREEPHIRQFYNSHRWRNLAKQVKLRDDYLCQDCLAEGIYSSADVVDHIKEVRDHWEERWNTENMRSLCHYHHNLKTREEKKKRNKNF
jgi:5-methylcytosine-specific restriction endonuclease McrA